MYALREGDSLLKTFSKEINLPGKLSFLMIYLVDTVLCMSFLNSLLFVGLKKQYCLVDISQGRLVKDICEISKNTTIPFCIPIQQHEGGASGFGDDDNDNKEQGEMLLSNDHKGLFYDFVGSPARGVFSLLV